MNPLAASAPRVFHRRLLRTVLLLAIVVLCIFVLGWMYDVLLTVFAGALLGVFLHGLALGVVRHTRWAYRSVVAALVIVLIVLIALCIWLVGPALAVQIGQLLGQIPATMALVERFVNRLPFFGHEVGVGAAPQVAPLVGAAANVLRVGVEVGAVWGVLGFAFATPMAVVATILVEMLYVEDVLGDRALVHPPRA